LASGRPIRWWVLLLLAVALLGYGSFTAPRLCGLTYVVINMAAMGAGLVLAAVFRLGATQTGLDPRRLGRSVLVGVAFSALAVPLIMVLGPPVAEKAGTSLMSDCPALDLGPELARIAVGTALPEEVLFRGLLLGAIGRGRSARRGLLWSSVVFGLWHVHANDIGGVESLFSAEVLPILLSVGVTFLAALFVLGPLRLRTGNVAASAIAHATVNASVVVVLFALPP
jgi:uncharacterized protein